MLKILSLTLLNFLVGAQDDYFEKKRIEMVEKQLKGRDIKNEAVLNAMLKVKREEFCIEAEKMNAYEDRALPIVGGQTISQPYIVAKMTELLEPAKGKKVLEIGTGSGYQAAVLAELGMKVYSIEIIPEVYEFGKKNLEKAGYRVKLKSGDGYFGWKEYAPFDAIIITAAPKKVPPKLVEQLKEGGILVTPLGEKANQHLFQFKKVKGKLIEKYIFPVAFVPMTGEIEKE
ncbi:MAG: protein-L-isoaspartate(D-aspartate) O-methyltransferase [bacterium]|nr:protein-L-isoaspartate(D-aspartate) O-methyltransferase [bacterium]